MLEFMTIVSDNVSLLVYVFCGSKRCRAGHDARNFCGVLANLSSHFDCRKHSTLPQKVRPRVFHTEGTPPSTRLRAASRMSKTSEW